MALAIVDDRVVKARIVDGTRARSILVDVSKEFGSAEPLLGKP